MQFFSWWLPPCKNSKLLADSFKKYWWSKNSAIWLDKSIFANFSGYALKKKSYSTNSFFVLQSFLGKSNDTILQKSPNPDLGTFLTILCFFVKIFHKKNMPLSNNTTWVSYPMLSFREKTNGPIPWKLPDWRKDRQIQIHKTLPFLEGFPCVNCRGFFANLSY